MHIAFACQKILGNIIIYSKMEIWKKHMCGGGLIVFVDGEGDGTSEVLSNSCRKKGREEHW